MSQKKAKVSGKGRKAVAPSEQEVNSLVSLFGAGQYAQAEVVAKAMVKSFPQHPFGLKALGAIYNQVGRVVDAIESMQKAIALTPWDAELHSNLGNSYKALARLDEAEKAYRKALSINPGYAAVYSNLGVVLKDVNRLDEAVACYRKALSLGAGDAQTWARLGHVLAKQGVDDEAEQCFREALAIRPDFADVIGSLAGLLLKLQRFSESESLYQQALSLNPNAHEFHSNRGNLLRSLGRLEEAEAACRQALLINSADSNIYNNLGTVLYDQKRYAEAEANFRIALALRPDFPSAIGNLGGTLTEVGRLSEAAVLLEQSFAANPQNVSTLNNLSRVYKYQGYFDAAIECLRIALQIDPGLDEIRSNLLFSLNYEAANDPQSLKLEAQQFGSLVTERVKSPFHEWTLASSGPLRVGFVSGDLHAHPVGYFMENLLRGLEAGTLELFAYPTRIREDEVTRRLKPYFSRWMPIQGLSDQAAARLIHDDGVHILIDLSGHTAYNRLPMFAWKPAPIQASWMGYFATTGMAEMDYFIGDPYVLPEAEVDHFTETMWPLPESYLCMMPPHEAPEVSVLPGSVNGFITFGSFNNLSKMNDRVVGLWAKVLEANPGSKLFLKTMQLNDQGVQDVTKERFAAHGIEPDRLILEGHSPRSELLAAYGRMDIALDPFPYPGGTTSAEALWMGVPVLTKRGDRFLSHVGESVVSNAGLADWIARDEADYIEKSRLVAADIQRLAQLRSGLRERLVQSPLFDGRHYARQFERAMMGMWNKWQATQEDMQ